MTIYIGGNSHTLALQKGLALASDLEGEFIVFPFGNGALEVRPFSVVRNGLVYFSEPLFSENLERHTGRPYFDPRDGWGFCMGTHNLRIFRHPFWSQAAPSRMADNGCRPVSLALVDAIIEEDQRYLRMFFKQLQSTDVQLFIVSCPLPRRDSDWADLGVPAEVVKFLDRRARHLMEEWLAENRIPLVPPLQEAIGDDGFLREEFAQKHLLNGLRDPHHANAEYGALMMRSVARQMGGLMADTRRTGSTG